MADIETAKLFKHGGSQAIRLPEKFQLPGHEVRVRRIGRGVLLEPMTFDIDSWLRALECYKAVPFMEDGRERPPLPDDDVTFDT